MVMVMFMPGGLVRGVPALFSKLFKPRPRGAVMLEVSGITQVFGGVIALEDVSFVAAKGDITGVIGPNGAGKTTLFNISPVLYRQTSGPCILKANRCTGLAARKTGPSWNGADLSEYRTFRRNDRYWKMSWWVCIPRVRAVSWPALY